MFNLLLLPLQEKPQEAEPVSQERTRAREEEKQEPQAGQGEREGEKEQIQGAQAQVSRYGALCFFNFQFQ